MINAAKIRPHGDLWMSESNGLRQFHASWRDASEHINAMRRFRKAMAAKLQEPKKCAYYECDNKQQRLSPLGHCDECAPVIQSILTTHRGRKNPR